MKIKKISKKDYLKELNHYKNEIKKIEEINDPKNILKEIYNALGW